MKKFFAFLLVVALGLVTIAHAQIPNKLSYQGLLTGASDGAYTLKFDIYNAPTAGTLRHTETFSSVSVSQGTFNVTIGSTVTLPAIFSESLYVEITATAGPVGPSYPLTFSPRSALTSSPYSLAPWSMNSGNLFYNGGKVGIGTTSPLYKFGIVDGPVELGFSPEAPAASGYIGTVSNHPLRLFANNQTKMVIQPDGKVGIGTGSPTYMLDVQNASGSASIRVKSSGSGSGVLYLDRPSASASYSSDIGFTTADNPDFTVGTSQGSAGNSDFSIYDYGTASNALTIVKSNGNVGIGTTNPSGKLTIHGDALNLISIGSSSDSTACFGVNDFLGSAEITAMNGIDFNIGGPNSKVRIADFNEGSSDIYSQLTIVAIGGREPLQLVRSNSGDGKLVSFNANGAEQGTITVSGSTVSYNAFTGSHYGWTNECIDEGTLVIMTGENKYFHNDHSSEIIYGIIPSYRANDPACLGAYLGLSESSKPQSTENPHLVMAVGNGDMWVADNDKDIEPGDFLISSATPGHAMRDNQEYPTSYVCAKAAERVNWDDITETIDGVKHKKISVLFESFARTNTSHDLTELKKTVETQLARIEQLEAIVKSLAMQQKQSNDKTIGELK